MYESKPVINYDKQFLEITGQLSYIASRLEEIVNLIKSEEPQEMVLDVKNLLKQIMDMCEVSEEEAVAWLGNTLGLKLTKIKKEDPDVDPTT